MPVLEFNHQAYDPNPAGNLFLRRLTRSMQVPLALTNRPSTIQWRCASPASSDKGWRHAPRIRQVAFLPVGRRVSNEIQRTLRGWLPYLWFTNPDHWPETGLALQMLFYAAMPIYQAQSKTQFTHELLDRDALAKVREQTLERLESWSADWAEYLSGRTAGETLRRLQPIRFADSMPTLRYRRDEVEKRLHQERCIIELFIAALEQRQTPAEVETKLDKILRRHACHGDGDFLKPLILAAADHAVNETPSLWPDLSIEFRPLTNLGDGRRTQEWPIAA